MLMLEIGGRDAAAVRTVEFPLTVRARLAAVDATTVGAVVVFLETALVSREAS
jgi:hypothetical protein